MRLADRFDVRAYARRYYVGAERHDYRGVTIINLPTVFSKHLDATLHTLISVFHLMFRHVDIVHVYSQGPCLFLPLIRLFNPRAVVFFTCGGLDWRRSKWSSLAGALIHLGEWFSARLTHVRVVVSRTLQDYYRSQYDVESVYIMNGVNLPAPVSDNVLKQFSLKARNYVVFVGRLVPEKRIEDLIRAFVEYPRQLSLAIVGDGAKDDPYVQMLRQTAKNSDRVAFTGYQYDELLGQLIGNAKAYVSASELEGLPLALLEGMSHGLPCLVSDISPHREALSTAGRYFPTKDVDALDRALVELETMDESVRRQEGEACRQRVARNYTWDGAAEQLGAEYCKSLKNR